ncbi:MAG: hypothetical protein FWH36_03605, partial [Lentimicrobiaceae bacterium]|nr:hypothetical protein [Lentimicrobiaceae bacterium]
EVEIYSKRGRRAGDRRIKRILSVSCCVSTLYHHPTNYLIIKQLRIFQELKELNVETLRTTSLRACTDLHDFF